MPARARCSWSKSELARQTSSKQPDRGGSYRDEDCQTRPHRSKFPRLASLLPKQELESRVGYVPSIAGSRNAISNGVTVAVKVNSIAMTTVQYRT